MEAPAKVNNPQIRELNLGFDFCHSFSFRQAIKVAIKIFVKIVIQL